MNEKAKKIQELLDYGLTANEIGRRLKMHHATVDNYVARYKLKNHWRSKYKRYTLPGGEDLRPVTRLRQVRSMCGITLKRACELADLPYTQVHLTEAGKLTPTPPMRKKLPRLYRVPEEVLFADWDAAIAALRGYAPFWEAMKEYRPPPKLWEEGHKRMEE